MSGLESLRHLLDGRPEVRLAYVFGSAARGRSRARSDVDLAVFFGTSPAPDALDRLLADLERAAGRTIDLVVLDTAPPLLAHEVVSTGKVVVSRDEDERARFEARVTARYLDTAHLRRVQHAYLRERVDARRARPR